MPSVVLWAKCTLNANTKRKIIIIESYQDKQKEICIKHSLQDKKSCHYS